MAQPQKPNNNGGKKRESYFRREMKNHRISGPINFLADKNKIQRFKVCKSICMDIASGVINPEEEYAYFSLPLIDEIISFTYSKWFEYNIIAGCVDASYREQLNMYGGTAVDERIIAIITKYNKSAAAYSILYQCFAAMKSDGNVIGWLNAAISQLTNGKYAQNI